MSTLTTVDKRQLEDLFEMGGGRVLDFTNSTFAQFFRDTARVEVYAPSYAFNGESKANRLRAFWEIEPDQTVGKVISELLALWHYLNSQPDATRAAGAQACARIAERLSGVPVGRQATEAEFLQQDFGDVSLARTHTDVALLPILESRLAEAETCLRNDAPLAVIFMCGSILEGLLLGVAHANPKEFNQAHGSPKDKDRPDKVKHFSEWRLADLIEVAWELHYLKLHVRTYADHLRDFRNYIHPSQQLKAQFSPDIHTARICMQVLKAEIADLSGERAEPAPALPTAS